MTGWCFMDLASPGLVCQGHSHSGKILIGVWGVTSGLFSSHLWSYSLHYLCTAWQGAPGVGPRAPEYPGQMSSLAPLSAYKPYLVVHTSFLQHPSYYWEIIPLIRVLTSSDGALHLHWLYLSHYGILSNDHQITGWVKTHELAPFC